MLGDKVKQLRENRKLTQHELANTLNIAQSTIGMIEGNKRPAGRKTLVKLADFFDVTVDYLLSEAESSDEDAFKLTKKDEKDIKKALNATLEQLENSQDGLMFDGEPIDNETRELLKISLENSMRLAKEIAKKKYTPKKYRK